jgi:transcriptional regulator with XRE-family HTH domain
VSKLKHDTEKNTINYEQLGLRIKEVRISKNLTQENIAAYAGCNVSHISNIENNHTKVSLTILLAIANALNTSIDYLLSNQYENSSFALDNEVLRALKDCDNEKKQKILKIISIL